GVSPRPWVPAPPSWPAGSAPAARRQEAGQIAFCRKLTPRAGGSFGFTPKALGSVHACMPGGRFRAIGRQGLGRLAGRAGKRASCRQGARMRLPRGQQS
ncbi:MAG: hypothetical protein II515_06750, partial [Desulfovibrio sp.]|nr:hypothetical protein [Desulfovibrio sp.]